MPPTLDQNGLPSPSSFDEHFHHFLLIFTIFNAKKRAYENFH